MEKIKRIDIREFRAKGFLQEANRQFFHPLGLVLEIVINDDTDEEFLGGIWDYRKDNEGVLFSPNIISNDKIDYVEKLRESKIEWRKENKYDDVEIDENGIQIS